MGSPQNSTSMETENGDPKFLSDRRWWEEDARPWLEMTVEDMLEKHDSSEITITFKQKWRDQFNNDEIHAFLKEYFLKNDIFDYKEIILFREFGDNLNMHYHGIVRGLASKKSQLKTWLNRRLGFTFIRMVRNTERYKNYLFKEQLDIDQYKHVIYMNFQQYSVNNPPVYKYFQH